MLCLNKGGHGCDFLAPTQRACQSVTALTESRHSDCPSISRRGRKNDHTLTLFLNSQLAQWRVFAALSEFRAVPHQELLAELKWLNSVEEDVQTTLARNQILLLYRTGWVDVTHPVAVLLIQTIQNVV